jgi:hypothetical protein
MVEIIHGILVKLIKLILQVLIIVHIHMYIPNIICKL